jgi:hypothetical protein
MGPERVEVDLNCWDISFIGLDLVHSYRPVQRGDFDEVERDAGIR